jgi:hypothetical protein
MPKGKPYARIAITLPAGVLAAADRLARRLDRSRSWVIAEAIRRFVDESAGARPPAAVHEPVAGYRISSGGTLGSLRQAQLEADLRLTPEERVRAAEETARLGRLVRSPAGQQVVVFDRADDYLRWKQRDAAGT